MPVSFNKFYFRLTKAYTVRVMGKTREYNTEKEHILGKVTVHFKLSQFIIVE